VDILISDFVLFSSSLCEIVGCNLSGGQLFSEDTDARRNLVGKIFVSYKNCRSEY
jgi:hypothetical protein